MPRKPITMRPLRHRLNLRPDRLLRILAIRIPRAHRRKLVVRIGHPVRGSALAATGVAEARPGEGERAAERLGEGGVDDGPE